MRLCETCGHWRCIWPDTLTDYSPRPECDCENCSHVLAIVNAQAEDELLWFVAETMPEAYLQQELRRLHAAIENRPAVSGEGREEK